MDVRFYMPCMRDSVVPFQLWSPVLHDRQRTQNQEGTVLTETSRQVHQQGDCLKEDRKHQITWLHKCGHYILIYCIFLNYWFVKDPHLSNYVFSASIPSQKIISKHWQICGWRVLTLTFQGHGLFFFLFPSFYRLFNLCKFWIKKIETPGQSLKLE